ncbi:integrase core domain-containing protein, partial [Leptospira borgpetersenii]
RMHRTLKQETALPPRSSLKEQQEAFDRFRIEYNLERPHEALEYKTPEKIYIPSERVFPIRIPEIAYATNIVVETVLDDGTAKYGPYRIFFGSPLIGERVGFEEVTERLCKIYFTNAVLWVC